MNPYRLEIMSLLILYTLFNLNLEKSSKKSENHNSFDDFTELRNLKENNFSFIQSNQSESYLYENQENKNNYIGIWKMNNKFIQFENNEGKLKIVTGSITSSMSHSLLFELFDGYYEDRKIRIEMKILKDLYNDNFNKTAIETVESTYFTLFEYLDPEENEFIPLKSHYELNLTFDGDSTKLTKIEGFLNFSMNFTTYQIGIQGEYNQISDYDLKSINDYFISAVIVSVFHFVTNIIVYRLIVKENNLARHISFYMVLQDSWWNINNSFAHLKLSSPNININNYLSLISFIYMSSYLMIEIKLLMLIWTSQNREVLADPIIERRTRFRIFMSFYLIMIISFFFSLKFYMKENYIILFVVVSWIFQIYHNLKYSSKCSLPLIYVVALTINKIFYPMYFRGYKNNFLNFSSNFVLIITIISIIFFEIFLIYLQVFCGIEKIFPNHYREIKQFEYHKTKDEIMVINAKIESNECVICLNSLKESYDSQDFRIKGIRSKLIIFVNVYKFFFNFYDFKKKKTYKPYMMTPCNHIFHTECLEGWIKHKAECPSCRFSLPNI